MKVFTKIGNTKVTYYENKTSLNNQVCVLLRCLVSVIANNWNRKTHTYILYFFISIAYDIVYILDKVSISMLSVYAYLGDLCLKNIMFFRMGHIYKIFNHGMSFESKSLKPA